MLYYNSGIKNHNLSLNFYTKSRIQTLPNCCKILVVAMVNGASDCSVTNHSPPTINGTNEIRDLRYSVTISQIQERYTLQQSLTESKQVTFNYESTRALRRNVYHPVCGQLELRLEVRALLQEEPTHICLCLLRTEDVRI